MEVGGRRGFVLVPKGRNNKGWMSFRDTSGRQIHPVDLRWCISKSTSKPKSMAEMGGKRSFAEVLLSTAKMLPLMGGFGNPSLSTAKVPLVMGGSGNPLAKAWKPPVKVAKPLMLKGGSAFPKKCAPKGKLMLKG